MNNREIVTDMDAAWQPAKALQSETPLNKEDMVVIEDDPHTFSVARVDIENGMAHIFREGHSEDKEPAWIGRDVKIADIVTLANITEAMTLHTNIELHRAKSAVEIISMLGK